MEVNRGRKGMILSRAFEFSPWTCSVRCWISWLIYSTCEKLPSSVFVWGHGGRACRLCKRHTKTEWSGASDVCSPSCTRIHQYSIFGFSFLMRMEYGGPGSLAVGALADGAYMIPTNMMDSPEWHYYLCIPIYFPPEPLHSLIMISDLQVDGSIPRVLGVDDFVVAWSMECMECMDCMDCMDGMVTGMVMNS